MDAKNLEATNGIFSVKSDINKEEIISVKKGSWSSLEDSLLINYIAIHGEGRWNFVARDSGLRRTGKSCRLRWKNYLRPNVRRGNFTLEEQLRIMKLHCLYGNRWSKIAKFLPDRTDNEIKNYWRSRVVKQAKQLKYDTNSVELREFVRDICLPRLSEKIHTSQCNNNNNNNIMNYDVIEYIGPEALQMDNWASWSNNISSNVMEAHQITVSDNLSTYSGCEFFNSTRFEMDFGQQYYGFDNPYNGCGFQGSDNPAWFSYGEISNMLLNND